MALFVVSPFWSNEMAPVTPSPVERGNVGDDGVAAGGSGDLIGTLVRGGLEDGADDDVRRVVRVRVVRSDLIVGVLGLVGIDELLAAGELVDRQADRGAEVALGLGSAGKVDVLAVVETVATHQRAP